jgi:L-lactate dehydrogenase complex protein LldE
MRIGLFVTCLVDLMRPTTGFAAIKLLESAGCTVTVPETQTCCGQPAFNSGDSDAAAALARKTIAEFEGFDYTVVPSGSCADQIRTEYPRLLNADPEWQARASALSNRTYELTDFLTSVMKVDAVPGSHARSAAALAALSQSSLATCPRQLPSASATTSSPAALKPSRGVTWDAC